MRQAGYLPLRGEDDDDNVQQSAQHGGNEDDDHSDEGGHGHRSSSNSSASKSSSVGRNDHRTGHLDDRHSPVTPTASATVATPEAHERVTASTTTTTAATNGGSSTSSSALIQGLSASRLDSNSNRMTGSPAVSLQALPLRRSGSSSSLSHSSSPFRFPRLGQVSKHTSRPSFLSGASSNVYGSSPKKKSFLGRIERGSSSTSYGHTTGEESLRSLLDSSSSSSGPGTGRHGGGGGLSLFSSKKKQQYTTPSQGTGSGGWPSDLPNIRPKRHPYTTSSGPRGIQKAQKRQILREIRPDLRHLPEALLREQAKAGAMVAAQLRRGSSLASESEWDDHMSSAETIDEGQGPSSTHALQSVDRQETLNQQQQTPLTFSHSSSALPAATTEGLLQYEQQIKHGNRLTGSVARGTRDEDSHPHDNNLDHEDSVSISMPTDTLSYSKGTYISAESASSPAPTPAAIEAATPQTTATLDPFARLRPAPSTIQARDRGKQPFQQPQEGSLGGAGPPSLATKAHVQPIAHSAPDVLASSVSNNDLVTGTAEIPRGEITTRIRRQRGEAGKRADQVLQSSSVFTPIEAASDQHGQPRVPPPALTPDHAEPMTSHRFVAIVESVKEAIRSGTQPLRIAQGSSGSYFCRNTDGKIVGVFKPKNEEPYGQLNPKWTKWVHRNLFPCCFGRSWRDLFKTDIVIIHLPSSLIPNLGYISESAASLVDRRLQLNIVPTTEVVWLASPAFHYDYLDRRAAKSPKAYKPLPDKVGSFQLFLNGFRDANLFMRDHPWPAEIAPTYSEGSALNSGGKPKGYGTWGRRQRRPSPQGSVRSNQDNHSASSGSGPQDAERASLAGSTTGTLTGWPAASINGDGFQWTPQLQQQFREQFEKMILLDYLIRNTDRGLDNWMIRYCEKEGISIVAGTVPVGPSAQKINIRRGSRVGELLSSSFRSSSSSPREQTMRSSTMPATPPGTPPQSGPSNSAHTSVGGPGPLTSGVEVLLQDEDAESGPSSVAGTQKTPQDQIEQHYGPNHVHIAAIDNGLAFPFKHPDSWRSYPYGWLFLPRSLIKQPFTQATRDHFLPLLSDPQWWQKTIADLQRLFRIDSDFDQRMFDKQMAVMKGQGWNIVETLKNPDHGPLDLCRRVAVVVWDEEVTIERRRVVMRDANGRVVRRSSPLGDRFSSTPTVTTKLVSPGVQVDPSGKCAAGSPADYVAITIDPPSPETVKLSESSPVRTTTGLGPMAHGEQVTLGALSDGDLETDGSSVDLENVDDYEVEDESDYDEETSDVDDEDRATQLQRRRRALSQDGLLPIGPSNKGDLSLSRKSRERGRQYRRALRKSSTSVDSGMALGGALTRGGGGGTRHAHGQQSLAGAAQKLVVPDTTVDDGGASKQDRGTGSSSQHVRRRTEQDDQMGSIGRSRGGGSSGLETGPQQGSHNLQQQHQRQIGFGASATRAETAASPSAEEDVHSGKKVSEEFASARRRWADRLRRGLSFDGQLLRGGLAGLDSKRKKGKREVIKERRVIRVERIEAVTTNKPYFTWW
ncbi:phosphatidyl inositol kinase [Actinomortierella ambigua]|nr:phosphatidyl inositol kinase [Actinomortierella ambigua]